MQIFFVSHNAEAEYIIILLFSIMINQQASFLI